ncbi:COP9 signalosome complex subunit 8 [Cimex lectularius]|uniref:COP9 signalosome complex subunit 8 n=1 Tax=Cimex lectularius TaxID=79782 RepID=A0A8I6SHD5_CIMLE|nr:COP9 signalosome complex subunit 8 [Cimex lectularius]XP_024083345.1 COP9 signalosome complex subunit 8 [Cimex lectularius]
MISLENIDQLAEELEKQELQAQGGVSTPQLYGQLLAIYLYQFDLCNAKFLWKRIPQNIKSQNTELGHIWNVGKAMWQRELPAVYTALSSTSWTDNVKPIMVGLKDKVREKCIGLVCKAYSSLNLEMLSLLLGMTTQEAIELAKKNGWNIEDNIIFPVQQTSIPVNITSTEQQLHKLTNFVSFLEN